MTPTACSPRGTTAIILTYKGMEDAIACLAALRGMPDAPGKIIVVDNGSGDGSLEGIKQWLNASDEACALLSADDGEHAALSAAITYTLLSVPVNNGYAAGNNAGIRLALRDAGCRAVWVLNNDTEPQTGSLAALCRRLNDCPGAGMVGSTLVRAHPGNTLQCAGGASFNTFLGTTTPLYEGAPLDIATALNPDSVEPKLAYLCGASMLVRREVFETLGFMDEEYFLYYEDVAFGLRARRAGYSLAWAPDSVVAHREGGSSGARSPKTRPEYVDYLALRNRIYLIRHYFPASLPVAVAGYAGVIIRRIARGQAARTRLVCKALWHGLTGKMGKTL